MALIERSICSPEIVSVVVGIEIGKVDKGMIPKVEACLTALGGGVPRTHIIDGREPHALLTEIFTDGPRRHGQFLERMSTDTKVQSRGALGTPEVRLQVRAKVRLEGIWIGSPARLRFD